MVPWLFCGDRIGSTLCGARPETRPFAWRGFRLLATAAPAERCSCSSASNCVLLDQWTGVGTLIQRMDAPHSFSSTQNARFRLRPLHFRFCTDQSGALVKRITVQSDVPSLQRVVQQQLSSEVSLKTQWDYSSRALNRTQQFVFDIE